MFNYTFHWIRRSRTLPQLLQGALVTLEIAVLSMIIGILLAIVLAAMRRSGTASSTPSPSPGSRSRATRRRSSRSTWPISAWPDRHPPRQLLALLVGITFNNAGYLAETFRGGLRRARDADPRRAIARLQLAAAFRLIVLPQMFRSLPAHDQPDGLGHPDDLARRRHRRELRSQGVTNAFNVKTFRTFEFFAIAAVMYYLIAKIVTLGARRSPGRLFRY